MQFFKGDETERKFYLAGEHFGSILLGQKNAFFDECYECFVLGELLYDSGRSPLANAIDRAIFRESFATIFDAFVVAGSFESYLTVFRNIFGDDVTVEFTVPGPGQLEIGIEATGVQEYNLLARTIVGGAYEYDEIIDGDGDNITALSPKGFQTQYEAEQMLREMVPAGIYTEITLTIA